MRAVRTAELLVVEVVAGAGEVLVRAVASSINPVDETTRQGIFGEVGDRVVAMSHQLGSGRGTWAELVAPVELVAPAPRAPCRGCRRGGRGLAVQLARARGVQVDVLTRENPDIGRGYDGVLRLRVDSTFAVRDVRAAHEKFRQGGLNGKVTLLF